MHKLIAILAGALLLALTVASAADAATVIFYSKSDNAYGWCAGVSYARGETCAKGQCEKYGNNCIQALECDGGYAATAFADDPGSGFGASCQYDNANSARATAIFVCIAASHTLCSTSEVFVGSGDVASTDANRSFDQVLYAQALLLAIGEDPGDLDGAMGGKTRAAITAFQSAVGLDQDGQLSDNLFDMLRYAATGTHRIIDSVTSDTDTLKAVDKYSFRYAAKVTDPLTFTAELQGRGDADQRVALATVLTFNGTACAIPAKSVSLTDAAAQTWAISCNHGDYDLAIADKSVTITPHQTDTTDSSNATPGQPATNRAIGGALRLPQGHSAAAMGDGQHEGGGKG